MSIYNMEVYKRERRAHWLKKALAWIGVIAAGSLTIFGAGVSLVQSHPKTVDVILVLTITGLFAWGIWGVYFLKTRH